MNTINTNAEYELYQIITDFGDPLEIFREAFQNAFDEGATKIFCRIYQEKKLTGDEIIFDIWNNGQGLPRNNVKNFFDLANSTKIKNNIPISGKIGYKGHGSKIFFNSKKVIIASKLSNDSWSVELEEPLKQLEEKGYIQYSEFIDNKDSEIHVPIDWEQGFYLKIMGHLLFNTEHTKFKLNHKNVRDYSKWFTVFGTIATFYDEFLKEKNIKLYLQGLDFNTFKNEYKNYENSDINSMPTFETVENIEFEVIKLGHYFPPDRDNRKKMEEHRKSINSYKPFSEFYSKQVFCQRVTCENNINFFLIVNIEGYETKREYDILLTQRGKPRTAISHTDIQRYGIWACKGGIPVEKVDYWIEGGKGQYSFLHAFIDCDDFKLTANRGRITNTEIDKLDIIKKKLNEIFKSKRVSDALNERKEIEDEDNNITTIEVDKKRLEQRFKESKKSREIILSDNIRLFEPKKLKNGHSESETMVLLIRILSLYPELFPFKILDYDTTKGIDFVVEENFNPKYIELKGTLNKKVNHPFKLISKFIAYDINLPNDDVIGDIENNRAQLKIIKNDIFKSPNEKFNNIKYTGYKLEPETASINSIEIINLKSILSEILKARFE